MRTLVAACSLVCFGCRALLGLEEATQTPDDAPATIDVLADASCSSPPVACFEQIDDDSTFQKSIPCSPAPVATCDPGLFRYCECGASTNKGGVMVVDADNETRILYATNGDLDVSLSIVSGAESQCLASTERCAIDTSCAGTDTLVVWHTALGSGTFEIRIHAGVVAGCKGNQILSVVVTR